MMQQRLSRDQKDVSARYSTAETTVFSFPDISQTLTCKFHISSFSLFKHNRQQKRAHTNTHTHLEFDWQIRLWVILKFKDH